MLEAIGLKLCSLPSPMLSLLTQALEVWRKVQLHVEPPDWIRISFCCPYLLQTHRADICNLLRQEGEHRPRVSILALIDEGWVARLWCLLKRSPDLAGAPLHNAPLAYPLHAVADTKNSESAMAVANLLLMFRARVDQKDINGETALHRAAYSHPGVVRLLIQRDACVNARSNSRALPLHYATQGGQPGIVSLLLEARATDLDIGRSFESAQHDGANALFLAVESNRKESVQLLLNAGAPAINAKKNNGISPILLACIRGNLEVLQMLLSVNMEDLGLPLNAIGGTWTSPLCEAIDVGHVATVRLLIDSRATVNAPSPSGESALILAVRGGHNAIVKLLLEANAVNFSAAYTHRIFTALYFACAEGRSEIVGLLLAASAGAVPTPVGRSPLESAAGHGHSAVVHQLLSAGACDCGGRALHAAQENGHATVFAMLRAGRQFHRRPLRRHPTW